MRGMLGLLAGLSLFVPGCGLLVPDIGGEGEPCFGDGTCLNGCVCVLDAAEGAQRCCKPDCDGKRCDDDDGCGGTCG